MCHSIPKSWILTLLNDNGNCRDIMYNNMLMIFFWFLICTGRQNGFSFILIQDTLMLSLLRIKEVIPFLDVFINNRKNILNTTTYHKLIYSGLLLNFDSFTSRFYKISLIKCLIDRAYKINNTWANTSTP